MPTVRTTDAISRACTVSRSTERTSSVKRETWPALTAEEQSIGEAYLVGYREGQRVLKIRLKDRLAAVTAQEFGT